MKYALAVLLAAPVALAQVTFEQIRNAPHDPRNWLTYSGNYEGHRHTRLAQIQPQNVARLTPAWIYQVRDAGDFETSPIVVDGILYITEKPHIVTALDGRTGRALWTYRRPAAQGVPGCCGPVNRGVAILDDTLFTCTYDARLLALDRHTGRLRWEVKIADHRTGHSMTAAPLALKDKIIVGIAGGEFGIRGFLDAYDPKTGKRLWRFWTIPEPGEPNGNTWEGDSWKRGGAATWLTGSYDPELNLIYWGTGNPAPDYNGDDREGDNLYSDSVVALDADTGKLRWYFQYTPHDVHDWDSNQIPVLVDTIFKGRPRKLLVQANRNGFYYVLDRATGEFLAGMAFAKQTWADGIDGRGRPIVIRGTEPTEEGNLVYPGLAGATNWFSPSYSPITHLFYVQAREDYAQVFYKLKKVEYEPGANYEGGNAADVEGQEARGVLKALDVTTGALRWQFDSFAPPSGGVLSTAGGLVFSGNREGYFYALDAATGRPLWKFQTGGQVWANPVSFAVDGRQHVAIAAGSAIFSFTLPKRAPASSNRRRSGIRSPMVQNSPLPAARLR